MTDDHPLDDLRAGTDCPQNDCRQNFLTATALQRHLRREHDWVIATDGGRVVTDQLEDALRALQEVDTSLLPQADAEEVRHARSIIDTVAWRQHERENEAVAISREESH